MLIQKSILLFFLLFQLISLSAQEHCIQGKVIDAKNIETLAFVHVLVNEGKTGSTTDIDGKFKICASEPIQMLQFSYVGYQSKEIVISDPEAVVSVQLEPAEYQLEEVEVFPAENPAHRIIKNVIANRDKNDPEKLDAFTYVSYDKMIFSIEPDSLVCFDTIETDTSDAKELKNFLEKHHLFLMESVSERKFMKPDRNREDVIATKISGFKDPIVVFLISQMQSTSFYKERIKIADKNYINPISKGSKRKYFFLLRDTTYTTTGDSVFIISYRPRKNTRFDGLKGVLSINTKNWAIQNVIAEPAKKETGISMRIEQMYELIDGKQWFPVQLKTEVFLGGLIVADSNIYISPGSDTTNIDFPLGIGKSYIRDINLNPGLKRSDFNNIAVEIKPKASERKPQYWDHYRIDSLTDRERNTYHFLDSLGEKHDFDRIAKTFETLMSGEIPWGIFNINLNDFVHYNAYEGLYLGLGGHTNEKLSRWMQLKGFWGYGFKDKRAKYGGDLRFLLSRNKEIDVGFGYSFNVLESGGVYFFNKNDNVFDPGNFRDFLIKRMTLTERWYAQAGFRALRHFKFTMGFEQNRKKAHGDYKYAAFEPYESRALHDFRFTELSAGFRFAFREKFIKTAHSKVSLGTKFPIINFRYTKGFDDIPDGNLGYHRFDLQFDDSFFFKYLGEMKVRLRAGYIDGNLPYCNFYDGNGSFRTFTIYAPMSFATMRMNEFLSNKYIAIYLNHNFGKLLMGNRRFRPQLEIVTNFSIGSLNNPEMHLNTDFKQMNLGYYESGVLVNDLIDLQLYKIGLGAFYRYGPYSFSKVWDNFAWKFSITFPF